MTKAKAGRWTSSRITELRDPADTNSNRFWFGIGQMSEGIKTSAMSSVVLFFYSQVLGLNAALAGLALLVAVITDGISDIVVGSWSDTIRHKWGRRHPLMYASIIPFGLGFIALFVPPDGLGETGLFIWLVASALVARNAMTLYIIPYWALGAELSSNYNARTTLAAYRTFFNYVGFAVVFLSGVYLFAPTPEYPVGQLNPARYPFYGILLGLIIMATILVSTLGTHNAIPHLPQAKPGERFSVRTMFVDLWHALRNRSFALMFSGLFIWASGLVVFRSLEIYLATYFWRLDQALVFLLPLTGAAAALIGTPLSIWLAARIGKRATIVLSMVSCIGTYALLIGLRAVGVFDMDTPGYVVIVFGGSFLASFLGAAPGVIAGSMCADVADEYDLETGHRREGILFGGLTFVTKMSTGVGGQLAGILIGIVGLMPQADPRTVSVETATELGIAAIVTFGMIGALGVALFAVYPLTSGRLAAIQRELSVRNAARMSTD